MVKIISKVETNIHMAESRTMRTISRSGLFIALGVLLFCAGCSSSKEIAVPQNLDRSSVPTETISMTAERFRFTPDEIHVKAGTLVHIDLKSINGTHGFKLSDFGIDESIDEGQTKAIEFYPQNRGEFTFRCSHFCGIGHFGMTGKIVVE